MQRKRSTEEIAESVLRLVTPVSLTMMSCSVCRAATVFSTSEHHSAPLSFSDFSCSSTLSRTLQSGEVCHFPLHEAVESCQQIQNLTQEYYGCYSERIDCTPYASASPDDS